MEWLGIIGVLCVAMVLSFFATRSWVFLCDMVVGGIKRLFGFKKKNMINWHTLQEKQEVDAEEIKQRKSNIYENEHLH